MCERERERDSLSVQNGKCGTEMAKAFGDILHVIIALKLQPEKRRRRRKKKNFEKTKSYETKNEEEEMLQCDT